MSLVSGERTNTAILSPRLLGDFAGCNPLGYLTRDDMLRLLDIYETESHSIYPLAELNHLRRLVTRLYVESATSTDLNTHRALQSNTSLLQPLSTLQAVLAVALVIENRGASHLASSLIEDLERRSKYGSSSMQTDVCSVEILALRVFYVPYCASEAVADVTYFQSLYHFYCDDEIAAWRAIGIAARASLEIGLHLAHPRFTELKSQREINHARRVFWCVYCLDRAWSLRTGLPNAIQDDDIDPDLPIPVCVWLHSQLYRMLIRGYSITGRIASFLLH